MFTLSHLLYIFEIYRFTYIYTTTNESVLDQEPYCQQTYLGRHFMQHITYKHKHRASEDRHTNNTLYIAPLSTTLFIGTLAVLYIRWGGGITNGFLNGLYSYFNAIRWYKNMRYIFFLYMSTSHYILVCATCKCLVFYVFYVKID